MVPASINVDPINPVVSQEADDENQQVSNNSTTLETCECYECGEEDVWEELASIIFPESVSDYIQKYREIESIVPNDAVMIDDSFINCDTYEIAKEVFGRVLCEKKNKSEEMPKAYIVSQQDGRFWVVLSKVVNDPTTFKVSLFAKTDEVSKKYLRRMFDDNIYSMDYLLHPEDYPHDDYTEEESVIVSESVVQEPDIKCFHCEKMLTDGQEYVDNGNDYCYSCADAVFYQEPESIVPTDAKLVDEYTFHPDCFESYEQATRALTYAVKYRVVQELADSYVVAHYRFKKYKWWCVLERDTFKLSLYANKDEVAMKYLRRQMEEVVDRMDMYQDGDSDDESDPGDPDFCYSCAPSTAATSAPFCCTNHMLCFEKGNGLKWCGGVEPLYHCTVCECEPYYRSQRHEEGYGWYASQSTEKGIRPIDSAICMFEELGLNTLLFENLVDLCEYF